MNWLNDTFVPTLPLWELALRGSLAFLALIALFRVVPKRNAGNISPNDMLVLIVVGGIGADAITGKASSAGDLMLMVALVLLWGYAIDYLEYRLPFFRRLARHDPRLLVENGRLLRRNMRREMVTEDEVVAALRRHGIADLSEVRSATVEADGEISVVRMSADDTGTGGTRS